jgi:serine phosphatase RsbU (regulator of sigma subunit)/anti-sigma regulatory factor (Ser/Thr protein kinase)
MLAPAVASGQRAALVNTGGAVATSVRQLWQVFARRGPDRPTAVAPVAPGVAPPAPTGPALTIAPNDPLVAYCLSAAGPIDVEQLKLESPAVQAMRDAGVTLAVPLISQGELIGLLSLGPRLSQQAYSADDRALLTNLARQSAPALRVAQLVRQQQAEARDRERIAQELRVARLIQQTLLPRELPSLEGWQLAAHYQPAREVGGDFYDFIPLPAGRLGIVVGDVTDKGVPAALVMSSVRSLLRTGALRSDAPGAVLQQANELLVPDIPANMFVTCLYAILDPASGLLRFANAGHDLPYRQRGGDVAELRATGMPLGLLPGMTYEETEAVLEPGDRVVLYSDGLVEAHDPARQMFGFPRLRALLASDRAAAADSLVHLLLDDLAGFTGPGWEQEDDITLVTLERALAVALPAAPEHELLAAFELPSEAGVERQAMDRVVTALAALAPPLSSRQLERLKTAVGEATMNAAEHGNSFRADVPVTIQVLASADAVVVRITDRGGTVVLDVETPDLEAKLEGRQSPRGWGLFLISRLVDTVNQSTAGDEHTVELIVQREEEDHAGPGL